MKKASILTVILVTLYICAANAGGKKVLILHTSDSHSCIYPLNSALNDTVVAGRGGYLRRLEMVRREREKNPQLLLFDSGDFSQGSPYYTFYKGDVEVELMNRMAYDAATIGNHEFDFGLENMARIFKKANFPIVCANYDFTGTPVEGLVKPYVVLRRGGLKIGVFGVAPKIDGLVDERKCRGVKFSDPAAVALSTATMLKEKLHCDLVVCISHLGWNIGGMDDQYMISRSRHIDVVLGGHSHTYLKTLGYVKDLDGKAVPVDHNGKHAAFVGRIELDMGKAGK